MRSFSASLYGYYLRSWRYNTQSDRLMEEAIERESWSPDRWKSWQEERISYVLHRAATKVPFYREYWASRRRSGDQTSWEYLENWPLLKKESVRLNPESFVADDCHTRNMFLEQTGGTTGTPLKLWSTKEVLRKFFAIYDVRAREWYGVTKDQNWATLGGKPILPPEQQSPPFWVWNYPMRQLYMSAGHLNQENSRAYFEALNQYGITHMVAYPSTSAILAGHFLKMGLRTSQLKVLITNGEALTPGRRTIIQNGLGCEVRETYGMAERVSVASECNQGALHLWPEIGFLETINDVEDLPVPKGGSGRFVCTSLLNEDMPLIRYDVGDRGWREGSEMQCPCGRLLPVLSGVEGRSNDLIVTPDGRRVYLSSSTFSGIPVRESQIIQEKISQIRVRYVPALEFEQRNKSMLVDRIQERIGAVNVIVEEVNKVPCGPNGKFRAVLSQLSEDEQRN